MKRMELLDTQAVFWQALCDPAIRRIGFGGSRGGGKSEISRRALVWRRLLYPGTIGILFRRTIKAVTDNHVAPMKRLLKEMDIPFKYREDQRRFVLLPPYSGEIHLGFAERQSHVELYQGNAYLDMAFDEATQFQEQLVNEITASNRCEVRGALPKVWFTCNPGGRGTGWMRRLFVRPEHQSPDTLFIPSRLEDNVILTARDPGYARRLTADLSDWKRRQWLEGDWDAAEGAYFNVPEHVVRPIDLRNIYWAKWVAGVDYGYHPGAFAVVWLAYWEDPSAERGQRIRAHVALELKRRRLELDEQADAALEMERTLSVHERIIRYADPSTGKRLEGERDEVGRTVTSIWSRRGFNTISARRQSRVLGWRQIQMLMNTGRLTIEPACKALLQELRDAAYHEDNQDEDMDAGCEDHLLDALRYAVGSIALLRPPAEQQPPW
ncbi:MAG TPA: terminase family protein [Chthonomonadales bacterium]|nr:terminase family protein [Chthonomonadales bacterium]